MCDNCPTVANAGQADTDADAVGDACDACPNTLPGGPVDSSGCAPGDFNRDEDVGLTDFSGFQACFNGPNVAPSRFCAVEADLEVDGDVDLQDFLYFQACFKGPNRPPGCDEQY